MVSTYGYTTAAKVRARSNYIVADPTLTDDNIDIYINNVEGTINGICKCTYEGTIPPLIESIASCMAAIYAITFDTTGFASGSEAALAIDVIWACIARDLGFLQDERIQESLKKGA